MVDKLSVVFLALVFLCSACISLPSTREIIVQLNNGVESLVI